MSDLNSRSANKEPNLYEIFLLFYRESKLLLKVFVGLMLAAILGYGVVHMGSSSKRVSLIALGGYVGSPSLSHRLVNVDELVTLKSGKRVITSIETGSFVPFLSPDYVERRVEEKFGGSFVAVAPMSSDVLATVKAKKQDKLAPYRPVNTIKLVAGSGSTEVAQQVQKILVFIQQLERPKREAFIQRVKQQIDYNERVMQGVDVAKHYKVAAVQDTVNAASILTTGLSMEKMKLLNQSHELESSMDSVSEAKVYLTYTEKPETKKVAFFKYLILTAMVSALIALMVVFVASVVRQQAKEYHQG